jgi:hypothetical protein
MVKMRNSYILIGKHEKGRKSRRIRHVWKNNNTTDDVRERCGMWPGFIWLNLSPVAGFCGYVIGPLGSIRGWILGKLSNYFPKKDSDPWS